MICLRADVEVARRCASSIPSSCASATWLRLPAWPLRKKLERYPSTSVKSEEGPQLASSNRPRNDPRMYGRVLLVDDLQLHAHAPKIAGEALEVVHVLGPVTRPARALDLEAGGKPGLGQQRARQRRIVLEIAGALAELPRGELPRPHGARHRPVRLGAFPVEMLGHPRLPVHRQAERAPHAHVVEGRPVGAHRQRAHLQPVPGRRSGNRRLAFLKAAASARGMRASWDGRSTCPARNSASWVGRSLMKSHSTLSRYGRPRAW